MTGIHSVAIPGESTGSFNFPTPFPTECYYVSLQVFGNGADALLDGTTVISYNRTTVNWGTANGSGTPYFMWRATGR